MSSEAQIPIFKDPPPPYIQNVDEIPAPSVGQQQQQQPQQPQQIYTPPKFRDVPVEARCPNCGYTGATRVKYVSGLLVWLAVLVLVLFGFILGCCLIPFCVKAMKDTKHLCTNCGTTLGSYKKLESAFK
ncbi:unnamed protein product [Didymodactylos carnosus]|uniref:LITAF domain-containing protein n=1 Tax=Didymodactylos carnosus TaxID=1234261 RepID=A0A8S2FFD9_9BILA|nr:unnamed protein product [Didymodactylos carnosus]CAF4243396.1 unnamed protein product [Didymodactylos carnosus]